MSSSSEARTDSTGALWSRRRADTLAVPLAAALTGVAVDDLFDAVALAVATSEEAARLLAGMEHRVRTLTSGVDSVAERCVYSVRGPVLWAETITARANALGNDDVFVCATASRSFNTIENRVLVAALDELVRAEAACAGPAGATLSPEAAARTLAVAARAREWRSHPRLSGLKAGRISARDMARLRGGHRVARMADVLAVRERTAQPFSGEDLHRLCDEPTRALHDLVEATMAAMTDRELCSGEIHLSDGTLRSGGMTFRHPGANGDGPAGLAYRGLALLPAEHLVADAPWADALPERGIRVEGRADVERVLDRVIERERHRSQAG